MERQIATLDSNGQLSIPAEMQTALGLHPGSQVQISIKGHHLLLQPMSTHRVDELYGIFRSKPGLAEELQADRRSEEILAQRRQEQW